MCALLRLILVAGAPAQETQIAIKDCIAKDSKSFRVRPVAYKCHGRVRERARARNGPRGWGTDSELALVGQVRRQVLAFREREMFY